MPLVSVRGHTFFPLALNSESIIVDAGANFGDFSRDCVRRFGCTPYSIEPNPASASKINTSRVFTHALAAETRTAEFFIGSSPEGCSLLQHPDHSNSITVKVVAFKDFLAEHNLQSVDLLKLDIEGAELELLPTLTTSDNISQISVEFHDFMFPAQRDTVLQTIQHMKSVGFKCINFSSPRREDVLFVNPRLVHLSIKDIIRAQARVKARSLQRRLRSQPDDSPTSDEE